MKWRCPKWRQMRRARESRIIDVRVPLERIAAETGT
jgi:hypothetical protein